MTTDIESIGGADNAARLAGTRICDREGRPLVLHHGTYRSFDRFGDPADLGHHFGTLNQAQMREREKWREREGEWIVRRAALAAKRVLVYPDDPKHWNTWFAIHEIAVLAGSDFVSRMREEKVLDPAAAAKRLRLDLLDLGYDAIAYRNVVEGKGGAIADWSFIALDPASIVDLGVHGADTTPDLGAIGAPGLDLPAGVRSIPGGRSASGSVRYADQRARLIEVTRSFIAESGGRTSDAGADLDFELPCAGLVLRGSAQAEMGRLRLRLDGDLSSALSGVFDDFAIHDMTGHGHRNRTQITYCWTAGETAEDFVRRFACGVDAIEQVLTRRQTMAPAA